MGQDRLISALLSDRFRIVRNLEKSGVNTIYEAEDVVARRRVAVKFIYPGYLNTRQAEARFRNELTLVMGLKSPNVAKVLDVGVTEEGAPYLVTEYLDGESLRDLLAHEGRLTVAQAVRFAVQTLRGLQEAHASGLFHYNIKPENLFVAKTPGNGEPLIKILDFGISKVRVSRFWRHMDAEMRSVVYMAPERLKDGTPANQRADLYSVGAVLYECLSGKPPYPGLEESELVEQILTEQPVDLEELRPGLPDGLVDAVQRAMSPFPADRFASAAEFRTALEAFEGGSSQRSIQAHEKPAAAPKPAKREWLIPAALGALVVAGIAVYAALGQSASGNGEPAMPEDLEPAPSAFAQAPVFVPSVLSRPSAAPPLLAPAPVQPAPSTAPSSPPAAASSAPVAASAPAPASPPSAAPKPSAAPAAPAPSDPANPVICFLNGTSGVISMKGPLCGNANVIKPNMKDKKRFPKWIPAHCDELTVYHCPNKPAEG
jgi:serine/threonine protein kinase